MLSRLVRASALAIFLLSTNLLSGAASLRAAEPLDWHDDYFTAYSQAEQEGKLLFIFFRDEKQPLVADSYQHTVLTDEILTEPLAKVVRVVVPTDIRIPETNELLLEHPAFAHQAQRQGIAILDLTDPQSNLYGTVISAHPFKSGRHLTARSTKIVLELPRGTITQRSIIYAARVHPRRPAGAQGRATVKLLTFAKDHSHTMARSSSMYHSNYGGMEIVANIGPQGTIIDTAKSLINMWYHSPAHWNILSGKHGGFGLDMQRSRNGHWYATGVFGR